MVWPATRCSGCGATSVRFPEGTRPVRRAGAAEAAPVELRMKACRDAVASVSRRQAAMVTEWVAEEVPEPWDRPDWVRSE